jgi:hypothetical protein
MTIEFGPKRLIQSKVCDLLEHYTFVKDSVILLQRRTDADLHSLPSTNARAPALDHVSQTI